MPVLTQQSSPVCVKLLHVLAIELNRLAQQVIDDPSFPTPHLLG